MSETGWIAISDRLPVDVPYGYCLVSNGIEVGTANYCKRDGWGVHDRDEWTPTHWMPFPEPPPAAFAVYDCDGSFVAACETLRDCEERYGRDTRNRYVPLYRKAK